jgi:DNA-directed RNA polymerase II subunit RPB7
MLKPYEREYQLIKEIPVEPHLLNCNINRIIKDKVWNTMKSVCSGEYGFVLRLNTIDDVGMGTIDSDNGTVVYPVTFTITTFKPNVGDIVIAKVNAVTKSGFFCQIGPLEIFVPNTHIPDAYEYKLGETNLENKFIGSHTTISCNEYARVKLCAIQKMDIEQIFESLSIDESQRQKSPYVGGVLEGIGELVDE